MTALSGELSRVATTSRSSLSDRDLLNGERLLRLGVVELCGLTVLNIGGFLHGVTSLALLLGFQGFLLELSVEEPLVNLDT